MEANMKYPLNPLAACFVPLSMKTHTGKINADVQSIEFGKSLPFYTHKHEASPANKTEAIDHSGVRNLDLIGEPTDFDDLCFISKKSEVNESVHALATPVKLISDEASIDRSEDRTSIEKDLMGQENMTGNCSMELERTSDMAYENTDPLKIGRTSDFENMDSIKTNSTSHMAGENKDSETARVGNVCTSLERGENLADYDYRKPGKYESRSSESIQSTKSYRSDYGTDVENIDTEDCSDLSTEMRTNFKSPQTIESEEETTPGLVSGGSERDFNFRMKNSGTLSLYLTTLLSSILPSKNDKTKFCSKKVFKGRSKLKEECICPPMFGWIIPFEYFGNPLNLTGACKKNYVHTTYEHAIYDHTARVSTTYRKSLDFENYSIDSGHCSDEDEAFSSIDEGSTLEQCSLELESIIKDVFDCVDKSLSLCEDEKPHTASNSGVWKTPNKTEVFQVQDSPVIDDGYHPLLQEITSEEEVNTGISIIEKFLGEAFTFGDKRVNERHSSQSCVLPCSVWCNNVPPPVIDTYKKFVKKIDSEPVNNKVADEKKLFKKPIYKRCFSANDTPKVFDAGVLNLASSWDPKELFYQKDIAAFTVSKGTANLSCSSGQPINPLKERSDKWSLYDGADSLWQPLPDCVLSSDHSQKYAYKKARIMRRQKSVG